MYENFSRDTEKDPEIFPGAVFSGPVNYRGMPARN
jgi:hypothetical protein